MVCLHTDKEKLVDIKITSPPTQSPEQHPLSDVGEPMGDTP